MQLEKKLNPAIITLGAAAYQMVGSFSSQRCCCYSVLIVGIVKIDSRLNMPVDRNYLTAKKHALIAGSGGGKRGL